MRVRFPLPLPYDMEKLIGLTKYNGEWCKVVQVFCPICGNEKLELNDNGAYKCLTCDNEFTTQQDEGASARGSGR